MLKERLPKEVRLNGTCSSGADDDRNDRVLLLRVVMCRLRYSGTENIEKIMSTHLGRVSTFRRVIHLGRFDCIAIAQRNTIYRQRDREQKCADVIGTVLVPWAGHCQ